MILCHMGETRKKGGSKKEEGRAKRGWTHRKHICMHFLS